MKHSSRNPHILLYFEQTYIFNNYLKKTNKIEQYIPKIKMVLWNLYKFNKYSETTEEMLSHTFEHTINKSVFEF